MGGTTAPVAASGSWPAWIAVVSKPSAAARPSPVPESTVPVSCVCMAVRPLGPDERAAPVPRAPSVAITGHHAVRGREPGARLAGVAGQEGEQVLPGDHAGGLAVDQ